jgi:hypothetical protein
MSIRKAYLVLYNLAACAGWAYVIALTFLNARAGASPAAFWASVGPALVLVQTSAALEIVHAALGLVPSGVGTTALQVRGPARACACVCASAARVHARAAHGGLAVVWGARVRWWCARGDGWLRAHCMTCTAPAPQDASRLIVLHGYTMVSKASQVRPLAAVAAVAARAWTVCWPAARACPKRTSRP